jgi:hypothetical protein
MSGGRALCTIKSPCTTASGSTSSWWTEASIGPFTSDASFAREAASRRSPAIGALTSTSRPASRAFRPTRACSSRMTLPPAKFALSPIGALTRTRPPAAHTSFATGPPTSTDEPAAMT